MGCLLVIRKRAERMQQTKRMQVACTHIFGHSIVIFLLGFLESLVEDILIGLGWLDVGRRGGGRSRSFGHDGCNWGNVRCVLFNGRRKLKREKEENNADPQESLSD